MPRQHKSGDLTVEIDLERPEATIRYMLEGWEWEDSPYQTADIGIEDRSEKTAWDLVNKWLDSQY